MHLAIASQQTHDYYLKFVAATPLRIYFSSKQVFYKRFF